MVDLDELERLHKAVTEVTKGEWTVNSYSYGNAIPGSFEYTIEHDDGFGIAEMHSSLDQPKSVAAFIAAIKNACDDGLLQRLRTAERERDEARAQTSAVAKVLNDAPPYQASLAKRAEELIHHLEVNDARLAALKAENERLRSALARIEMACELLASTRPIAVYDAMIAAGQSGQLLELDNARREARDVVRATKPKETTNG